MDYDRSGECAAGTGSFLDQQALRMEYSVEEVGSVVSTASCAARIAGRCSVFAKTDMIHAQQKGYSPAEILRGLCDAVARNFKSGIVKGRKVDPPVALIGAVSQNAGVTRALREAFGLTEDELIVPELYAWCGAIGTAMLEAEERRKRSFREIHRLNQHESEVQAQAVTPLSTENVVQLRDRVDRYAAPPGDEPIPAYLGLDIGSVSTNVVAIDEWGARDSRRLPAHRRPAHRGGAAGPGGGREGVGQAPGDPRRRHDRLRARADRGVRGRRRGQRRDHGPQDRRAAHQRTLGGEPVDTIFEIGGQDSKFISIENGVVVDFAMNEACAAGTGSFLEEQAEKLGISIKGEFAQLALSSPAPTRLGERCTVFMERDVTGWLHKGETVPNLVAGLAYSIALNYLNRVVRGGKIGNVIYFQGGTAYNDAVTAAFASLLGKKITVPPYNGVMGAIGMALIARQWQQATSVYSKFRGYDLSRLSMTSRDFVCKACSNLCDMKEFIIEGQKSYWGDKCSDKFRKPSTTGRKPVIEDLFAFANRPSRNLRPRLPRTPRSCAWASRAPCPSSTGSPSGTATSPNSGIEVVLSPPTDHADCVRRNGTGGGAAVLPGAGGARARAGAARQGRGLHAAAQRPECRVRRIFLLHRALLPLEPDAALGSAVGAAAGGAPAQVSDPHPALPVGPRARQEGPGGNHAEAGRVTPGERPRRGCGLRRAARPFRTACSMPAGARSGRWMRRASRAWCWWGAATTSTIANVNCDIPRKLRHRYGANVIPARFPGDRARAHIGPALEHVLDLGAEDPGRRAKIATRPNLHLIYITNFKCGPDSYIKHFTREAAGAPLLVLQFDGHGNDAGYMTRCEAYLDSKGILRCYQSGPEAQTAAASIH